ncbi:tripartite tricarboxylate transporter substrate-binding protein [Variovorax sp. YR266]|uniref:tripartite tricarboxylate transporter substrate-binding protein n=1 Tax=Variovorax sp. YR266 TaxID=1884386 RepID=UPI000B87F028|nr:tripartite tricarboxylate transporter substrate-binding protein [Variovorax sp. YR266]
MRWRSTTPGAAPATTDLLAGRINFTMNDPVVSAPFIKSGQLRVLGVTSKQRLSMLPDVAPLAEQRLPDYDYASWSAMFAPAGLPPDIARKLHQIFARVMADTAIQKFAKSARIIPLASTPEGAPCVCPRPDQTLGSMGQGIRFDAELTAASQRLRPSF